MQKFIKNCLFFTLIFSLIISCQKKTQSVKRLNISFNVDPRTLDPRKSADLASSSVIFLLFNGLTELSNNGQIKMAIASSYDLSADQKTYVFHLREAKWSDGNKITAYDFEESWKKILTPEFSALCPQLFFCIKNAEKAYKKEVSLDAVGIIAIDEKTLLVQLTNPTPYFLSLTSFCIFFPTSSLDDRDSIITSGPFILKKWNHNNELILKKNPLYWNEQNIKLDEIHIKIIRSENTALQMFENGDLHLVGSLLSPLPIDSMNTILKRKEVKVSSVAGTTFCAFNVEKFPFNNKNMRKAFGLAINRKAIVQNITQGKETIATRCIPLVLSNKNLKFYEDNNTLQAKEYFNKALEELHIKKEDLSITFSYRLSLLHKKLAETLVEQWMKTFDIPIKLQGEEEKVMLDKMHKHDFQSALCFYLAQYLDPMNILSRFKNKDNVKNYPLWENERFAELLDYSSTILNQDYRKQILEKAEEILIDEMPIAPIYHHNYIMLLSPSIKGLSIGPLGDLHFDKIQIN